jgi:outer membrane lipoprotein-sorting protein
MSVHVAYKCRYLSLSIVAACAWLAMPAQGQEPGAWSLKGALEQLSEQADGFATGFARASAEWKDGSGAVTRKESGQFYVNEDGSLRFDVAGQDPRVILVVDRSVFIYEPGRKLVEEFPLSRHPDRVEPYAALGFSNTGEDLERDYLITLLGENQSGNQRLLGFELTPKKDAARSSVARVALWIDQASWLPVTQEIVMAQGGQTLKVTYDRMVRNRPLDENLFKARWPKGVEEVKR